MYVYTTHVHVLFTPATLGGVCGGGYGRVVDVEGRCNII